MEQQILYRSAVFDLTEYMAGKTVEEVKRELGLEEIIKLSSNENPYGPPPAALEAIKRELPNIFMYPEKSFLDLKAALAEANGVHPRNVVVGHGSETIIQLIPQLYINPGDEVIIADKTYGRYEEASKLMGAAIRHSPLQDFTYDLQAITRLVNKKTKIVWVCNPNNPTGTIVRYREVRDFLAAIPAAVTVVFDQAYFEYVDDPDYADALQFVKQGARNIIVLRTFSKAYGLAGLRLGYAIAHEEICRLLDTIKEPFNLNRLSIAAGPASLQDKKWLQRVVESNKLGREYLLQQFHGMQLTAVPSQTNFILVNVRHSAAELFRKLMRKGILIRPATAWGYDEFIRVTIGTRAQNEVFIQALKEELV